MVAEKNRESLKQMLDELRTHSDEDRYAAALQSFLCVFAFVTNVSRGKIFKRDEKKVWNEPHHFTQTRQKGAKYEIFFSFKSETPKQKKN